MSAVRKTLPSPPIGTARGVRTVDSDSTNSTSTAAPTSGQERHSKRPVASAAKTVAQRLARCLPLVVLFAIWELASRTIPSMALLLPAPSAVVKAGLELTADGTLQMDALSSLQRVGVAMAAASLIGFPLGAAIGGSKTMAKVFEPIVGFFRPIPPLAWIPLSIMWFGITDAQNEFIIFLAAFFPILLNTVEGVRDIDQRLVRAARTLGASRAAIARTVILPGALSSMFVGLRVGIGIAWMALVAGELVAATSGLGFLISQGRLLYRSDQIVVGMVVIGIIGLVLDGLVRLLQRIVTPWREE